MQPEKVSSSLQPFSGRAEATERSGGLLPNCMPSSGAQPLRWRGPEAVPHFARLLAQKWKRLGLGATTQSSRATGLPLQRRCTHPPTACSFSHSSFISWLTGMLIWVHVPAQ
jgi:hypothetical protein